MADSVSDEPNFGSAAGLGSSRLTRFGGVMLGSQAERILPLAHLGKAHKAHQARHGMKVSPLKIPAHARVD